MDRPDSFPPDSVCWPAAPAAQISISPGRYAAYRSNQHSTKTTPQPRVEAWVTTFPQSGNKVRGQSGARQGVRAVLSRRRRLRGRPLWVYVELGHSTGPPLCGLDSSFRSVRSSLSAASRPRVPPVAGCGSVVRRALFPGSLSYVFVRSSFLCPFWRRCFSAGRRCPVLGRRSLPARPAGCSQCSRFGCSRVRRSLLPSLRVAVRRVACSWRSSRLLVVSPRPPLPLLRWRLFAGRAARSALPRRAAFLVSALSQARLARAFSFTFRSLSHVSVLHLLGLCRLASRLPRRLLCSPAARSAGVAAAVIPRVRVVRSRGFRPGPVPFPLRPGVFALAARRGRSWVCRVRRPRRGVRPGPGGFVPALPRRVSGLRLPVGCPPVRVPRPVLVRWRVRLVG